MKGLMKFKRSVEVLSLDIAAAYGEEDLGEYLGLDVTHGRLLGFMQGRCGKGKVIQMPRSLLMQFVEGMYGGTEGI